MNLATATFYACDDDEWRPPQEIYRRAGGRPYPTIAYLYEKGRLERRAPTPNEVAQWGLSARTPYLYRRKRTDQHNPSRLLRSKKWKPMVDIDHLTVEIRELGNERDSHLSALLNLLAAVHGDDGQYTEREGIAESTRIAHERLAQIMAVVP